jgi:L-aminopeptidase/D-esterase-like protein
LAAADGVMLCLERQGSGFPVGPGQVVPIVPSAILFDPGRCAPFSVRPDASFGMAACQAAQTGPVQQGNVGAGTGARSGGIKGGLGTASTVLQSGASNGIIVGAIVAVNSSGRTFDNDGNLFAEFLELGNEFPLAAPTGTDVVPPSNLLQNTTIAVIATNATLTKAQATKVAQMADDGLARAIKPSHGVGDGDTIFVMATGTDGRDATNLVNTIGSTAADTLSRAVVHAILAAQSVNSSSCTVKSYCDTFPGKCAK